MAHRRMKLETAGNIAMVATSSKKRSRVAPLPDRPEAGEVEVKPVVINGDNSSSKNTSKFSQASETFITNSSKDESSSYTDTKVSITFLGFNITSKIGIQAFKVMSVCIPLIPTLLLILYNSVQLEGLWSRSSILAENYSRLKSAISLSVLVSALQDERYNLVFMTLTNVEGQAFNISEDKDTFLAKTDTAISKLDPWREEIPVKIFASRIRFQIRIDDLRELIFDGKGQVDDILDFYNLVTDALLNQYSKEVRVIKGSKTWKNVIVYKNILRAIDNIGINAAIVLKYYIQGNLNNEEMVQYLKSQVQSQEYLTQASNFSPDIRLKIKNITSSRIYKKLEDIWEDVEDETRTIDASNVTEVKKFTNNLYDWSLKYLNEVRSLEALMVKKLRMQSNDENSESNWDIIISVSLIIFILVCVAPFIVVFTLKTTMAGETFIEAMARRSVRIAKEQKRSEKLILKLLPPVVATRLIEQKKVSFTYDAATVMFCSLYGFADLINTMEPLQSFDMLNMIYDEFDAMVSNFDVYKVESIGDKYMVASGIPKENGNKHAAEIARLALAIVRKMKILREDSSRFPRIYPKIGAHSGNAVAGVIGSKMPRFCLFGETINLASRMESHGVAGKIQISVTTKAILELTQADSFEIQSRGCINIKGKGVQETFWLVDRKRNKDPDHYDYVATSKLHVSPPNSKPITPAPPQTKPSKEPKELE